MEVFYCGSWRPAEIVCGNGRTYFVRYNHCHFSSSSGSNTSEVAYADRVPRKALRPLPPVKEKANKWVPGDVIEVLVHGSWKPAKVTGVAYGNEYYFVSLLDNCRELAVKKLNLRKQRKWENGKWVTIKKVLRFSLLHKTLLGKIVNESTQFRVSVQVRFGVVSCMFIALRDNLVIIA